MANVSKIKLPDNTIVNIKDARNVVIGDGLNNIVTLTRAQYNALSTKDANTVYVLSDVYPVTTSPTITVSTSEPTSSDGDNGDIWLVV